MATDLRSRSETALRMHVPSQLASLFVLLVTSIPLSAELHDSSLLLGRHIKDFEIQDFRGKEHRLSDYADSRAMVVAFLGTECPLVKLYGPRLEGLAKEYALQGVTLLGINANQQDSLTEIAAFAHRHKISFPILKDVGNHVADQFGATRTPEVFLLDTTQTVRYHGRIDDQYGVGVSRGHPQRHDLKQAINELLAGRPITNPQTTVTGCLIGRVREPNDACPVTYSHQIARLLNKHCVQCHRAGEIAPFALTSYDEVAGWAGMLEEVVRQRRMPPWHANPAHGKFANARRLTDDEKELLYQWVHAGAPEGDPADLPPQSEFVAGWRLPRDPDVVIPMRDKPFVVPAEGVVEYQYFAIDPDFDEDKWVSAADVVPGERSVVHHVIVFISPPEDRRQRGLGLLAAYVPGQSSLELPAGQGRLIPAGSKLIFQMHYTPVGTPRKDLTKLGLVFAEPDSITEEIVSLITVNPKFEIPPHVKDHPVESSLDRWPRRAKLLAIAPHMHLRGKSFRCEGVWPDGRREVLLDVPQYDFNWQTAYQLADPIDVPARFVIDSVAHFDNSADNLANPDPTQAVRWGDQTWNEMMIAFFEVAVPSGSWEEFRQRQPRQPTDEDRLQARQIARSVLQRFDANRNGQLERKEAPGSFSVFAFRQFDANRDRIVTEQELYEEALRDLRRKG